ncbi:inhibitor of trypsin and hageman factor-like [Magnolia sinica]|uniref:inhibitor of trypsin and hageman factor-like n=1 Tax=Magnolia sinica TaxID=86752 RepID=UPI00265A2EC6|nr:inhibitor of trypsin and hageman factor-like [Magnolia sinica]
MDLSRSASDINTRIRRDPLRSHSGFRMQATLDCKDKGKSSWPEMVGMNGEMAAMTIQKENPHVEAIVLLEGTPVTTDYRCDRVWVWVNQNELVVAEPHIG